MNSLHGSEYPVHQEEVTGYQPEEEAGQAHLGLVSRSSWDQFWGL